MTNLFVIAQSQTKTIFYTHNCFELCDWLCMLIPSCRQVVKVKSLKNFTERYVGSNPTSKLHQRRYRIIFFLISGTATLHAKHR